MNTEEAFSNFIEFHWHGMDNEFKKKYKIYRSRFINKTSYVGENKMKEILIASELYNHTLPSWTEKL